MQTELDTEIGNIDLEILKPARVEIRNVEIQEVGEKKTKKLICSCKHPDREEAIEISSVKYLKGDTLKTIGLWFTRDKEEKIPKGSALASFMTYLTAANPRMLVGKTVETVMDDNGYLTFKAY